VILRFFKMASVFSVIESEFIQKLITLRYCFRDVPCEISILEIFW